MLSRTGVTVFVAPGPEVTMTTPTLPLARGSWAVTRKGATRTAELVVADGGEAKIVEYEKRSAVEWLVGGQPGNTIGYGLTEENAISSTGVDLAKPLFPRGSEARVAALRINPGGDVGGELFGHEVDSLTEAVRRHFARRR